MVRARHEHSLTQPYVTMPRCLQIRRPTRSMRADGGVRLQLDFMAGTRLEELDDMMQMRCSMGVQLQHPGTTIK